MFDFIKYRLKYLQSTFSEGKEEEAIPQEEESREGLITPKLSENIVELRKRFSNSSDLLIREMQVSGQRIAIVACEGMISLQTMTEILIDPIMQLDLGEEASPEKLVEWVRNDAFLAIDRNEIYRFDQIFQFIMSGFTVILIDGVNFGYSLGMQGFQVRSISEPSSDVNVRGSREGFVEALRINLTMIRRRLKSDKLKFDIFSVGKSSKTDICMVYRTDAVSSKIVYEVKNRLKRIKLDVVLESGYIQPFLEQEPLSFFSTVGVTERPDAICAKISEGRIGILVDGTPFALVVPSLFVENFQSFDDYAHRPFYATFVRILKYLSFFFTVLLPGVYVAVATFHPELFPDILLYNIARAEEITPFPPVIEALIIHFIYEIMREAGLRLPRPIGHAVSIVGALVIGDAAVTAGLIGSPMVMVVALTAISAFVVPSLYESVTLLRFLFMIIGGVLGLYGIALGLCLMAVNLCAKTAYGIPYTAPISPLDFKDLRDVFVRLGWKKLGKKTVKVQHFVGSEVE